MKQLPSGLRTGAAAVRTGLDRRLARGHDVRGGAEIRRPGAGDVTRELPLRELDKG